MRIVLTDPSPSQLRAGNFSTVKRWAAILRKLRHRVIVHRVRDPKAGPLPGGDLLIALHAGHSHRAIRRWKRRDASAAVVLALSGTDLHQQLPAGGAAGRRVVESLEAADQWVALHRHAERYLPADLLRSKGRGVHFIPQSALPLAGGRKPIQSRLRLLVIGYLRDVKDPLLPVQALKYLPQQLSDGRPIEVVHLGGALSKGWQRRAERAAQREPRWCWLGTVDRTRLRRYLASSHLLIHPSLEEGGANVISEALVAGIPILASDAPGNLGLLGDDHPGLFRRGDARQLANHILRWVEDGGFKSRLETGSRRLGRQHTPTAETAAWRRLLTDSSLK